MDSPIHIDTISMALPIVPLKGSQMEGSQVLNLLNYDALLSMKVVLIIANREDPDEMQHYAAFHLGLHCLPKYPFRGF